MRALWLGAGLATHVVLAFFEEPERFEDDIDEFASSRWAGARVCSTTAPYSDHLGGRLSYQSLIIAIGFASILLTGVGVLVTLKSVRDQLWLQMFSEYTRRYQEIVGALPSDARDPQGSFEVDKLDAAEQGRVLNAARGFLNLCAEEYYLFRRGRIDKETWSIWRAGIEEVFRLPWLRQTWAAMRDEYAYYEPFCTFVDECIAANEAVARPRADGQRRRRSAADPRRAPD